MLEMYAGVLPAGRDNFAKPNLYQNLTWLFGDRLEKRRAYEKNHPEVLWSHLISVLADNNKAL